VILDLSGAIIIRHTIRHADGILECQIIITIAHTHLIRHIHRHDHHVEDLLLIIGVGGASYKLQYANYKY